MDYDDINNIDPAIIARLARKIASKLTVAELDLIADIMRDGESRHYLIDRIERVATSNERRNR